MEQVIKNLGFLDENDENKVRILLGFSLGLYFETVNNIFTGINKNNSVGFRNVHCQSVNIVNVGFALSQFGT